MTGDWDDGLLRRERAIRIEVHVEHSPNSVSLE